MWSAPHHYRKGTRVIWSFGLHCAPQSCRDFKNSDTVLSSNTVMLKQLGVGAYLKSLIGIFSGAHQMPMECKLAPSRGNQEASLRDSEAGPSGPTLFRVNTPLLAALIYQKQILRYPVACRGEFIVLCCCVKMNRKYFWRNYKELCCD